ncbi:MAG: hypothetical protein LBL31_03760 [Spirochaetaceae bacterium]|nr:hypothetical protein [Spirochaetaceae bacterium]
MSSRETSVRVVIFSCELAEAAVKNARDERGVRVVGRLAGTVENNNFCIVAEHVEYRPEFSRKNKKG